jgi:hypothetical protein
MKRITPMTNKTTRTDALVTADDVLNFKAQVDRSDFQRLAHELIAREPELTIALSEKFDLVLTLLEGATMSIKQRAVVRKQVTLLVWMPVLLMAHAHRRSWDDFLPSEEAMDEPAGGKGEPQ